MSDDNGRQSFRDLVIHGLEQVNDELKDLRKGQQQSDQEWRKAVADLQVAIAKLETRIAIYSGLGAIVGGAVVTWVAEQWHGR
jgi:hypothetical protein